MILRCPHCKGACSLPDDFAAPAWACPRCHQTISSDAVSSAASPPLADGTPPRRSSLAPKPGSSSSPTNSSDRTAAQKNVPKDATKPAGVGVKKKSSLVRAPGSGPSQIPTPIDEALCDPVPRWPRRFVTLTCLILSVLLLASSGGVAFWKVRKKPPQSEVTSVINETSEAGVSKSEKSKKPNPPPRSQELYGGIEIGSKSVKYVVVRLGEPGGQGPASELAAPVQTANTTLVNHLKDTGILDPEALRDTIRVVGSFHGRLRNEHQLPPERIYIIVSSGLFSSIQDKPEQIEANKRHLRAAVQKATGQDVAFLDKQQDLELTFRASVPSDQVEESLLVDLSSGKTSVCYSEGGLARFVTLAFPFGSKPLSEEANQRVQERGGKFADRMSEILKDSEKLQSWREGLQRNPALVNLKRVYLTGGPLWALATITHPQERGPHVALSFADVEGFARQLEECPPGSIPEPKLMEGTDESVKREVEAAMRGVRKTFTREQLLAGMRIMLALGDDLGFKTSADKKLMFARDGYLGPALGYAVMMKQKTH